MSIWERFGNYLFYNLRIFQATRNRHYSVFDDLRAEVLLLRDKLELANQRLKETN